jgi:hypothetical protein
MRMTTGRHARVSRVADSTSSRWAVAGQTRQKTPPAPHTHARCCRSSGAQAELTRQRRARAAPGGSEALPVDWSCGWPRPQLGDQPLRNTHSRRPPALRGATSASSPCCARRPYNHKAGGERAARRERAAARQRAAFVGPRRGDDAGARSGHGTRRAAGAKRRRTCRAEGRRATGGCWDAKHCLISFPLSQSSARTLQEGRRAACSMTELLP